MDTFWAQILAFFIAFIPGVVIALLADTLSRRRDAQRERRVNENARTLLALEVGANLGALRDFWRTINGLDTEHQNEGVEAHFAAMAQNGLLGYTAPRWSVTRWERLAPQTADSAISPISTARSSPSPTTSAPFSTMSASGTIALLAIASASSSGCRSR
jgi:hypothetical protein